MDKSKLAPPHQEEKFRLIFESSDPEMKLGLDSNYKPKKKEEDDE